jgi:hypothetical protein
LPLHRREALVLDAFERRPDALWHLLPHTPTQQVIEVALLHGPKSSASAEFHAFGALVRNGPIAPVLEAIRMGRNNRDVLIRAVAASGSPAAAQVLIAALSDRNERLRAVARDGLVALGPAVLPQLFAAFDSSSESVQSEVAHALRGMRPDAQIAAFCIGKLGNRRLDVETAAAFQRIALANRIEQNRTQIASHSTAALDAAMAAVPAPNVDRRLPPMMWFDGTPLSPKAQATLGSLVLTEAPQTRCDQVATIRHLLHVQSVSSLLELGSHGACPPYRWVLADDTTLLRQHYRYMKSEQDLETWIDVLSRHASAAAVHALDELWRRGHDSTVQTAAMAALMRLSGAFEGLESFADVTLRDVLGDDTSPLHDACARGQFDRFERMMISARRVDEPTFRAIYMTRPAQAVLWGVYDPGGVLRSAFRLDEEMVFVDEHDAVFELPPDHKIGVAHPAELGVTACRKWAEIFAEYELMPQFEQL